MNKKNEKKSEKSAEASDIETAKTSSAMAKEADDDGSPAARAEKAEKKDAVELLKDDHRRVEALFQQFQDADNPAEKRRIVDRVAYELIVHSLIEERLFYPACRGKIENAQLDEAQVEHDGVKLLLIDLRDASLGDSYFDAKVTVLSEYVKHHVAEEEKRGDGIMDAARKAGVDLEALGKEIAARKPEIAERVGRDFVPDTPSLATKKGVFGKEKNMPLLR